MADRFAIAIICGPTATGKTGVAVKLAEPLPVEVVSADSRQMIRRLDIGTAKPTEKERQQAPIHLVDIIEPGERYSAFRFIDDANAAIGEILKRGNLPLVVGGTGLYLRALTEGVVEIDNTDMEIREKLEQECADGGAERLYQKLREIDPLEAAKIHPNNHVRLVRALEIFYVTGKPKSELVSTGAYRKAKHTFQYHCLAPDREQLYRTINDRVDRMLADGLLDEVERLVGDGLADPVRQSNVIGYNELLDYLDGRWGLDEAVAMIKQNTRRYAKRQLTWFRGQPGVRFYSDSGELFATLLEWGRGALDGAKKT